MDGTTFGVLTGQVEAILNNTGATADELKHAKDLAEAVNQHDKNNPDCGTGSKGTGSKADTKSKTGTKSDTGAN